MSTPHPLQNLGIHEEGQKYDSPQKTFIVLGAGRGGTSMCAGALHHLDIFMGEQAQAPIFEDTLLGGHLENRDFVKAAQIIEKYNNQHDVWGFKRPTTLDSLTELHQLLRNPTYIIIFRDIYAISLRNQISMNERTISTMRSTISDYSKIIDFIDKNNPHRLMISYEKALLNKETFSKNIIEITDSKKKDAQSILESEIHPSPLNYVENTNITGEIGYLDRVTKDKIYGWACTPNKITPAELTLYIEGVKTMSFIADKHREDILKKGIHPNGNCGFEIQYETPNNKPASSEISVRFQKTNTELKQSPQQI